ncbi:MAG: metallophosphoesterase, partial [Candidatus Eremiobacteraeota bacterium]|nr:metallophosphoesterase [Candidatus Eremiobacteraeota bacterium]
IQDRSVVVEGLKIYGSPWQPAFNNWAFNVHFREQLAANWRRIPDDTDILITHTPPVGILDDGRGCQDLAERLERVQPKLHLFGHIHVGHGQLERGKTRFVNACICDYDYRPLQPPIVIDL